MDGLLHEKNVEIAYLVDPDADVLANAVERVKARNLPEPKGVADVRKALEDPDLTAVTIATPHQWHALITVWGCQAGKHVYVEKPCSHTIHGGRVAVTASRKYNTIVQHGTQQRSDQTRANQMKAILEGKFGKLLVSHGHASKGRGSIGVKPVEPVPANVNWDLWRGPAMIPDDGFHRNFVHYNWHWFWITGNGEIGNQGVHQMDVARWALGKAYPKRVMSIGGRFAWNDQGETPNSQFAVMDFGDDQYLFFTVRNVTHKGYQTEVKNDFYFEDYRLVNNKLYRNGSDQEEKVDYPKAEITPGGAVRQLRQRDSRRQARGVQRRHRDRPLLQRARPPGEHLPSVRREGAVQQGAEGVRRQQGRPRGLRAHARHPQGRRPAPHRQDGVPPRPVAGVRRREGGLRRRPRRRSQQAPPRRLPEGLRDAGSGQGLTAVWSVGVLRPPVLRHSSAPPLHHSTTPLPHYPGARGFGGDRSREGRTPL